MREAVGRQAENIFIVCKKCLKLSLLFAGIMNWESLTEAFNKPSSRNVRLALSLLFITMTTIVVMIVFQMAKHFLDPDMTIWESHIYTILFTGIIASLIALFVLSRFEGLYGKVTEENEERKRAEATLINSEARFRTLFEDASDAIFIADVETGAIIDCNSNAEKLIGRPRSEIIGLPQTELHPHGETEKYREIFQQHVQHGGIVNCEMEVLHNDGRRIPVIISARATVFNGKKMMMGYFLDITERKRAEEALRESEAMLRQIIDTSPIPMVVYREEKNYHINKKFVETFGYTMEDIPTIDEWWPLAYPDKAYCEFVKNRWYAAVDDAVKNKTSIAPQEVIVTCKDGSKKGVLTFFSSIGDMNLAILQDITERKQDEEKVSHLASFPSLNPNPIVETDLDGNPSYMNPSARTIFPDLNEKGAAHPVLTGLKAVVNELEVKKKSYLVREVMVEGSYFQETIHSVPDKKALRIYVLDITTRKRAEEAVRESDVRFRSLIQNSSDIIRIMDKEGRIIFDSPSSENILGYPAGYMLGKLPFDFIHPDDLKLVRKELDTVYGKRNSGIPVEFRIRKADGEYLWVESIGVNMIEVPGVDGIVITTRPIGERKKAEEETKAAKQQAELYVDLMGHDINNLHQIALGYLELARDMPAGEGQAMFLDKPVEVLQRSTQLIQNVRKLQKLRDGVFKTELVDVCKVLSDVQREFGAVPNKHVTLNFNGYERCFVRANELLYDVFANLVSNAIKHTGDRADIIVDLDVVKDNGSRYYRVVVEDNGPGIPDDFKARIFNRMLKGTNNAKGMGLGLYLVKSLVDSYGGRVWVEDRVLGDHTKGAGSLSCYLLRKVTINQLFL